MRTSQSDRWGSVWPWSPATVLAFSGRMTARATPAELLSDRELKVFDLTGRGLNITEIAGQLHIAVKTVETYRARIKDKLKLKDSSELLQLAISWNQRR